MSKVITFSRIFPSFHPRKGEPTYFFEKLNKSLPVVEYGLIFSDLIHKDIPFFDCDYYLKCEPKYHTIRAGNRWKAGDKFSPRVWGDDINPKNGRTGPYQSKQIIIAPDIEIKKVWSIKIIDWSPTILINDKPTSFDIERRLHENDGLTWYDFYNWFNKLPFSGQIICWSDKIEY